MPRPRTGTLIPHGDHFDARITMPDRSRPIFHLPAGLSEARAQELATEYAEAAGRGELTLRGKGGPRETVAEWFSRWTDERERRGLTSARKDVGRLRKWLFATLGQRQMALITTSDLEALVEALDDAAIAHADAERRGERPTIATMCSWKSARNTWGLVAKGFDDATRSKTKSLRILETNPATGVRPPDKGVKKARSFLSPTRFSTFVAREDVPRGWRLAVAFAVYTYARAAELRGLTWTDVHLDEGYMQIHQTVDVDEARGSTKTGLSRLVPIERELLPLLRSMRRDTGPVLELPDDQHMARGLRRWLDHAELDAGDLERSATRAAITWHDLRATGITWRIIRGDDPMKVSAAAGHLLFSTTQVYIRAAEVLGSGFGAVFPALPASLLESSADSSSGSPGAGEREPKRRPGNGSGRRDLNRLPGPRSAANGGETHGDGRGGSPVSDRSDVGPDDSLTIQPPLRELSGLAGGLAALGMWDLLEVES